MGHSLLVLQCSIVKHRVQVLLPCTGVRFMGFFSDCICARRQVVISGVRNSLNLISFQSEESIAQDSSQYAETGKQDFLLNRMAPWTIVASREYPFYCSCFWWNETRFPLTNSHSKNNAKSTNEQIIYFTTLYLSVMYSEALICALQDRLLILQKVKSKMRRKNGEMVYAAQESYNWCYGMFI